MAGLIMRFDHEDYLLREWAYWTRIEPYCQGFVSCSIKPRKPVRQPRSDGEMLRVDQAVARLPVAEKRILKRFYLRGETDVHQVKLDLSLQAFSRSFSPGFNRRY